MRIIISSAGRRVYLVQWFQQALRDLELNGQVYVLDNNSSAAAAAAADGYRQMPAYTSPEYAECFWHTIDEIQPNLFLSLNDYELTTLSQGLADQLRARGVVVPTLDAEAHLAAADKLRMCSVLTEADIPTPKTVLLSDTAGVDELLSDSARVIVKDRLGSGSSGLRRFTADEARQWLNAQRSTKRDARKHLETLVMQPDLGGVEYGMDVVAPVNGGPLAGVLTRRKLGMRHGETSAAITVDKTPFQGLAAALNATLGIRGTVDVDFMLTEDNVPYVIDINPRFGGGYPFSHIAGADVPHFIVASTAAISPKYGWNKYQVDYIGAKHEGIIGFDAASTSDSNVLPQDHRILRPAS